MRLRQPIVVSSSARRSHLHNRHEPIAFQQQTLKLQGHYAYSGITGNLSGLQGFLEGAEEVWKRWLSRRRGCGTISWPDSCDWSGGSDAAKHVWLTACPIVQRTHSMTSPMREIRTSGSVEAPGAITRGDPVRNPAQHSLAIKAQFRLPVGPPGPLEHRLDHVRESLFADDIVEFDVHAEAKPTTTVPRGRTF